MMTGFHPTPTTPNGLAAIAFLAGSGIGSIYFGGLWLTIRQLSVSRYPFALFFVSLLLRLAIAMGGFYLIIHRSTGDELIIILLICICGFLIVRNLFIYLDRRYLSQIYPDRFEKNGENS